MYFLCSDDGGDPIVSMAAKAHGIKSFTAEDVEHIAAASKRADAALLSDINQRLVSSIT